jgi:HK97 family phage major capsid protein
VPTATELRTQRAAIIAQSRQLVDKAAAENRDMTSEENTNFEKAIADADKLAQQIKTAEQREWVESQEAELRGSQGRRTPPAGGSGGRSGDPTDHDYAESMRAWALAGTDRARADADTVHRAAQCGIQLAAPTISLRALSKGTPTAGGNTVPTGMVGDIIEKMAFFNPIRQKAAKLTTDSGSDLDYPRTNDTGNSASIVGEGVAINTNADPAFDKVTLKAWKYATTIVKVSVELLQDSAVNVPALLARLLAKRMSRGQATHFVTGNGTTQPEGLATLATVGATLASGNAMTGDKLIDLIYSADKDYRAGASFLFHDETIASIVKLKDTTNQYLWQPGLQAGQPDTLKGYPVDVSNALTSINAPGDNQVLGLFGNIGEHYLVRDVAGSMQMTRLNELYAATGEIGFVLLLRTDGRGTGHSGWMKSLNSFDTP